MTFDRSFRRWILLKMVKIGSKALSRFSGRGAEQLIDSLPEAITGSSSLQVRGEKSGACVLCLTISKF